MTEALSAWSTIPLDVLRGSPSPLVLVAAGVAFGALHAWLPGHGKALLAARWIDGSGARDDHGSLARISVALGDGVLLAASRTFVAFILVVATVEIAILLGVAMPVRTLRLASGAALLLLAVHLLVPPIPWRGRSDTDSAIQLRTGRRRRSLLGALALLALTPEPVALAVASFGIAQGALRPVAWFLLGLALGVGAMLAATTLLVDRSLTPSRANGLVRFARVSNAALAAVLAFAGAIVIASAL